MPERMAKNFFDKQKLFMAFLDITMPKVRNNEWVSPTPKGIKIEELPETPYPIPALNASMERAIAIKKLSFKLIFLEKFTPSFWHFEKKPFKIVYIPSIIRKPAPRYVPKLGDRKREIIFPQKSARAVNPAETNVIIKIV